MGSKTNQNSDQVQTLNQDDKGVKMSGLMDRSSGLLRYFVFRTATDGVPIC